MGEEVAGHDLPAVDAVPFRRQLRWTAVHEHLELRGKALHVRVERTHCPAVGGFVLVEGVTRLFAPPPVAAGAMVVFGTVGLLGNAVDRAVYVQVRVPASADSSSVTDLTAPIERALPAQPPHPAG